MKGFTTPTLADVGKLAGVTSMTASMVMRGDPRISEKTRKKVQRSAQKLGYIPDPVLSALVARRSGNKSRKVFANLAVLIDDRWIELQNPYWPGLLLNSMRQTSEQLGYHLEILHLKRDLGTVSDPNRILQTRGIRGLLLPSTMDGFFPLRINWENFSLVTTGIFKIERSLHRVESDYFAAMDVACRKLQEYGYRRVLLAHPRVMERRVYYEWLGAITKEHFLNAQFTFIPPYLPENPSKKNLLAWVLRHKPDSVITNDGVIYRWLREGGYRIPEDLGVVFMSRDTIQVPDCAGVSQNIHGIGDAAVNLLHSLLLRGEKGFPASPCKILVQPKWQEGNTVKNLSK